MKNLFKSLANFQQEVPVILKDTQAYGYKYADLPEIFKVINPLLKKHGIGFAQPIEGNSIKTIIFHIESGETLESITEIPQNVELKGMNSFQVLGSAITYIRRYALSSILGLITDKDTDASGEQVKDAPKSKNEPNTELNWLNKGTEQFDKVKVALKDGKATMEDVRKKFKVSKEVENLLNQ
jgi:hypothetical protein